jgi:hypothetical protein
MSKPRIDDLLELQDLILALDGAGWQDPDKLRVDPPIARMILDTHELAPALQQMLVAMAIGALASMIFKAGGPVLVERTEGPA